MSETDELWKRIRALERFQERIDSYDGLAASDILHNATQIQGEDVDNASPTDLQLLQYIASVSEWQPKTLSVSGIHVGVARASSDLTLSNSWQDVAGCIKTITFESGDLLLVWAIFDFEMQYSSSTNDLKGGLNFNSTLQSQYAHFEGGSAGERGTVGQVYLVSPGTGSKTFKLQAARTTTGSGDWCKGTHTSMFWMRAKIFTDES
jgi:hypothetical protein